MTTDEGNETPGLTEDELKAIFRSQVKEELDERGITAEIFKKLDILDGLDGLFEKHKGDPDSLVGKIGELIDAKLKGIPSGGGGGGGNGKTERKARINIFGAS